MKSSSRCRGEGSCAVKLTCSDCCRRFIERNDSNRKSKALNDMVSTIGSQQLTRMGIHAFTVFEYGDNLTLAMNNTISRSKK